MSLCSKGEAYFLEQTPPLSPGRQEKMDAFLRLKGLRKEDIIIFSTNSHREKQRRHKLDPLQENASVREKERGGVDFFFFSKKKK